MINLDNVKKSNKEMRGRWKNKNMSTFLCILAESQKELPEFHKSINEGFTVLPEVINYTIRELKQYI